MALTLLLVRHGETTYNAEKRYQGQKDVPLSEVGQAQARQLADRLAHVWKNTDGAFFVPPPVAVYASDLARAHETAEIITQTIEQKAALSLPIQKLPLLRERHFGVWEGLTHVEIRAQYGKTEHAEGGETWDVVWARMNDALAQIWDAHAQQPTGDAAQKPPTVMIVGHGGSLRALVCRALGVDAQQLRRFRLDNVSLTVLDFWGETLEASEGRVAFLNDTAHLSHVAAATTAF